MADKSIAELAVAQQMSDEAKLVVYQGGETRSIEGQLIKGYAKDAVKVYVEGAKTSAKEAEESAAAAEAARGGVEAYAEQAGLSAAKAAGSATAAQGAATEAAASKTAAQQAAADAQASKEGAALSEANAAGSETAAQAAKTASETAQRAAEAAKAAAESSATTATNKATEAGNSATAAAGSATAAGESADAAEQARQAIEALGVQGVTLPAGGQVAVEKVVAADGSVTLRFSIPQGAKGDKGDTGNQGVSITSIERTAGNGAAGTTDTYTITLSDGSTSTFGVYNGRNGEGSGDMIASVYDPQGREEDVFAAIDAAEAAAKAASRPVDWLPEAVEVGGVPLAALTVKEGGSAGVDYATNEIVPVGALIRIRPGTTSKTTSPKVTVQNTSGTISICMIRRLRSNGTICIGPKNDWLSATSTYLAVRMAGSNLVVLGLAQPVASDIDGIVPLEHGGLGVGSATAGSYLVGNGTEPVRTKTPAEVLEDIGAADKAHTHPDIVEHADAAIADLPVKTLVGTADSPIDLDSVQISGIYYCRGDYFGLGTDAISKAALQSGAPLVQANNTQSIYVDGNKPRVRTYARGAWSEWESREPITAAGGTAKFLTLLDAPEYDTDATNKQYVDSKTAYQQAVAAGYTGTEAEFYAALVGLKDGPFLALSGGTMTGDVDMDGAEIRNGALIETVAIYVNSITTPPGSTAMELDAQVDMVGNTLAGLPSPTNAADAANKEYVDSKAPVFTGKTVPVSAWTADTTYSAQGYGWRAAVACAGVTASHRPDVAFSCTDAVSGNFAPVADSYAGGVYIYCKTKPTATVTIPSIVCVKGV